VPERIGRNGYSKQDINLMSPLNGNHNRVWTVFDAFLIEHGRQYLHRLRKVDRKQGRQWRGNRFADHDNDLHAFMF
jgi:hypothetical protein